MQKLPIGEQFFTNLRQKNMIYVDKTQLIHEMMNVGSFVFLSRPRRFGKSLLTTTLKELCRGNRALFQGLFTTGTPSFLIKLLRQKKIAAYDPTRREPNPTLVVG